VFEERLLRKAFGRKRDEVTGERSKLHYEELNDLHSSPNIVRVIRTRVMRWARQVPRVGKRRVEYRVWWGNLRERDHLEEPGVDRKIILKLIFRKWDVEAWTGSS